MKADLYIYCKKLLPRNLAKKVILVQNVGHDDQKSIKGRRGRLGNPIQ